MSSSAWLMTRASACAISPQRSGSPSAPPTGSCPSWSKRATCCAKDRADETATRSWRGVPCVIPSSRSARWAIARRPDRLDDRGAGRDDAGGMRSARRRIEERPRHVLRIASGVLSMQSGTSRRPRLVRPSEIVRWPERAEVLLPMHGRTRIAPKGSSVYIRSRDGGRGAFFKRTNGLRQGAMPRVRWSGLHPEDKSGPCRGRQDDEVPHLPRQRPHPG